MTQRWAIPLLVLAFIAFYLLPLGTHGLWIPDETRYAQIGQQILIDGNWVTRTLWICVTSRSRLPATG